MSIESILFYCFAILSILTAFFVISSRNPVYSVLFLIITMFALAAIYIMLHAYFIAAIQLIIYAGAIMVLFLFVVMLLNLDREGDESFRSGPSRWFAIPIALAFILELFPIVWHFIQKTPKNVPLLMEGTAQAVGTLIFTKHL